MKPGLLAAAPFLFACNVSLAQERLPLPQPGAKSAEKVIQPPATMQEAHESFEFCVKGSKRPDVSQGYMRLCLSGWMDETNVNLWDDCVVKGGEGTACFEQTFKLRQ